MWSVTHKKKKEIKKKALDKPKTIKEQTNVFGTATVGDWMFPFHMEMSKLEEGDREWGFCGS